MLKEKDMDNYYSNIRNYTVRNIGTIIQLQNGEYAIAVVKDNVVCEYTTFDNSTEDGKIINKAFKLIDNNK